MTPSTGFGIAGTIGVLGNAFTAYQQGQIAQIGYQMQESTLRNNMQVAQWNAEDAKARGEVAISQQRKKTKQMAGTQRAMMAAAGLDLTQGSPLRILTDTAYMGAMDEDQIRQNVSREASAYRMQAVGLASQAEMQRTLASSVNPGAQAAGTLLSGATQVAANWYNMVK